MASKFLHNQSSTPRSKKWVILPVLAILILASGGSFIYFKNKSSSTPKDLQDRAQVESSKDRIDSNDDKVSINVNPDKAVTDVSNQTTEQTPISTDISISLLSQTQADGLIKVAAKATGTTGGRCVFSFTTEGDRPVVRESSLSSGACNVEIPEVEFSKIGVWNLNISLHVNNTRTEVNQNVTIN